MSTPLAISNAVFFYCPNIKWLTETPLARLTYTADCAERLSIKAKGSCASVRPSRVHANARALPQPTPVAILDLNSTINKGNVNILFRKRLDAARYGSRTVRETTAFTSTLCPSVIYLCGHSPLSHNPWFPKSHVRPEVSR